MLFSAIVHKEEDIYVAECSEIGTVSQGFTIEEAVENLKDSTQLFLEEFPLEKSILNINKKFSYDNN
jgi:predicted RNase H-like HicB family nuclease